MLVSDNPTLARDAVGPSTPTIEKAFAKLKALLRKAAARTLEVLWSTIGRIIDLITPAECVNMFASAGYDPD